MIKCLAAVLAFAWVLMAAPAWAQDQKAPPAMVTVRWLPTEGEPIRLAVQANERFGVLQQHLIGDGHTLSLQAEGRVRIADDLGSARIDQITVRINDTERLTRRTELGDGKVSVATEDVVRANVELSTSTVVALDRGSVLLENGQGRLEILVTSALSLDVERPVEQ